MGATIAMRDDLERHLTIIAHEAMAKVAKASGRLAVSQDIQEMADELKIRR